MKKVVTQVTMTELFPDQIAVGSAAWRLLEYTNEYGFPSYDVFRAEYEMEDDGDAESGPSVSVWLGSWECVVEGIGLTTLEEEVARYNENKEDPS